MVSDWSGRSVLLTDQLLPPSIQLCYGATVTARPIVAAVSMFRLMLCDAL